MTTKTPFKDEKKYRNTKMKENEKKADNNRTTKKKGKTTVGPSLPTTHF